MMTNPLPLLFQKVSQASFQNKKESFLSLIINVQTIDMNSLTVEKQLLDLLFFLLLA